LDVTRVAFGVKSKFSFWKCL